METGRQWTVFWVVLILTFGAICINGTNRVQENTARLIENGYSKTTLPGLDTVEWVKGGK